MIHLLVPYDFSKTATYALDFATKLSDTYSKLRITLLHVVEFPLNASVGALGGGMDPLSDFQNQIYFKELVEQRQKDLQLLKTKHSSTVFDLEIRVQTGSVFREITAFLEETKPDLVVMGSAGTSGWEEVFIGSTTEKVVRSASCPVITVKGPTDPSQIKKIVFASDFDETNTVLAARIKNMQQVLRAEMYFVCVVTPGNFKTSREAQVGLNKFIQRHAFKDIKTEIYMSLSEESGILEFAEDVQADLIAMSTHGRSGFLHLLTGSIAEDVVNHSKKPVWTLKTTSKRH